MPPYSATAWAAAETCCAGWSHPFRSAGKPQVTEEWSRCGARPGPGHHHTALHQAVSAYAKHSCLKWRPDTCHETTPKKSKACHSTSNLNSWQANPHHPSPRRGTQAVGCQAALPRAVAGARCDSVARLVLHREVVQARKQCLGTYWDHR